MLCNKKIYALLLLLLPAASYAFEWYQTTELEARWAQLSQEQLELIRFQIQQSVLREQQAEATMNARIERIERQLLGDKGKRNVQGCTTCQGCIKNQAKRLAQQAKL